MWTKIRANQVHFSIWNFFSSIDKIEKSKKKETEDLKAFELLEEAACDSSFRSDSSTVKKLIENVSMPSPIPNRSQSHTSTPKNKSKRGMYCFLWIRHYQKSTIVSIPVKLT